MANSALVNDFADKNTEDIKSNNRNSNIYLHIYACMHDGSTSLSEALHYKNCYISIEKILKTPGISKEGRTIK